MDKAKGALMPHFKCVACKTRLYNPPSLADPVGELCPECGTLLEPVRALAEVVGFRSITSRDGAVGDPASSSHERMAERCGHLIARREVIRAQARLKAEGWLDEGPSVRAEVVSLPRPEANS